MKYTYVYKTSDGVRHEASMDAKCREDVFVALRGQHIKPIKVVAADGSKANGEIRGVRKRVVVTIVLVVALGVGVTAYWGGLHRGETLESPSSSVPRHQIYGDPVLMESIENGRLEKMLPREGDRMLAWFAQPGCLMLPKGCNPRHLTQSQIEQLTRYATTELAADADLGISDGDQREVRELKQIVNGMREEFRAYLANGNGTPRSFWRRLIERTQQEIQIYERTRRELANEKSESVWEEKNDILRRLGLRTIANTQDGD